MKCEMCEEEEENNENEEMKANWKWNGMKNNVKAKINKIIK